MPSPACGICGRVVTGNSVSLERAFGGAGLPPPSILRHHLAPEYAARYEEAGAASHGTVLHHDKSAKGTRHERRCYEAVAAVVNKTRDQPELLAGVDYSPPPPAERRPRADEVQRLAPTRGPRPAAELSLENAHSCNHCTPCFSACDALSAMPCTVCGTPAPPKTVGDAAAALRKARDLPPLRYASEPARNALPPRNRPRGGPAILQAGYDSSLITEFERVNGPLGATDAAGSGKARASGAPKPVLLECACCSGVWYFDYVWDLCARMQRGALFGDDNTSNWWECYLSSPARSALLDEIVGEQLAGQLERTPTGDQLTLTWHSCFNCEAESRISLGAPVEQARAKAVAHAHLSDLPRAFAEGIVSAGVLASPEQSVPLEGEFATFKGLRAVTVLVPASLTASLSADDAAALHGVPFGAPTFEERLHRLDRDFASTQARGVPFEAAVYLLASDEAAEAVRLAAPQGRDEVLRAHARSLTFLAAVHFGGLPSGYARDGQGITAEEDAYFVQQLAAAEGGELSGDSTDDNAPADETPPPKKGKQPAAGAKAESNRTAAGRCGRWWDLSGLARNNTFIRQACHDDPLFASHGFVVAPPTGTLSHVLVCYVSDLQARPMRITDAQGNAHELKGDRCPGRPRAFKETPGRRFRYFKHNQNIELQQQARCSSARGTAVAESRVRLLLFLSHCGIVPRPAPPAEEGTRRRSKSAEASSSRDRDQRVQGRRERAEAGYDTTEGAPLTARRTWEYMRKCRSKVEALSVLAHLKGFYVNLFPATLHKDSDNNIESWTLRPDLDIAHAFFKHEEHGAWDAGPKAAGGMRGESEGKPSAFNLQSGGCSPRRFDGVLARFRQQRG